MNQNRLRGESFDQWASRLFDPPKEEVSIMSKVAKKRTTPEAHYELAKDADGRWQWCLWSSNGRAVAVSVQGFETAHLCRVAIKTMENLAAKELRTYTSGPAPAEAPGGGIERVTKPTEAPAPKKPPAEPASPAPPEPEQTPIG